ncbi:MAG: PASTA domain-containing protein, partial [Lactobacillus iners]|nr:PASTA domain-containing protein [Lactobacillus iners]
RSVVEMKKDLDTSLEPSRRFEPPFVAEHNPNKDATIVLPVVDGSVKNTAEIKQNLKDSNKNSAWLSNFKKHKWWWITTAFAFMMIILIFIFALGRKDYVKVPELNNLDEMQAKRVLISRGLRVGKIYHKFSSKIKNNHVINVTPKSGTSIKKYQKVNLIISKGDGLTAVPNVIYEYFEDAQEELQDLGFKVIKKEIHSSTVEKGVVVEQNLFPGKKVVADKTKIVLTVSKGGKTHKKIKLRDLTGYSLKSLKDYIKDKGLILKVIEEDSSAPQGTVIRQDPEAGTKLSRGDCVTVVVSRDNGNILIKKYDIRYDSSSDRGNGNHIQVFISDDSHKFSNTYVDTYITTDKTISVPLDFSSSDEARVRIVQDGKIIVDEDIRK